MVEWQQKRVHSSKVGGKRISAQKWVSNVSPQSPAKSSKSKKWSSMKMSNLQLQDKMIVIKLQKLIPCIQTLWPLFLPYGTTSLKHPSIITVHLHFRSPSLVGFWHNRAPGSTCALNLHPLLHYLTRNVYKRAKRVSWNKYTKEKKMNV